MSNSTPANPRRPGILDRDANGKVKARPAPAGLARFRCAHLGGPTGKKAKCLGCGQHGRMGEVLACGLHGECSGWQQMEGIRSCQGCTDNTASTRHRVRPEYGLVAPLGARAAGPLSFLGVPGRKRSWTYPATVALPHLDTLEYLAACVDLIRLQDSPPYILVLDTGSPPDACARLEEMRAADLEIHYVHGHDWIHSSQPVAAAMDLAFTRCRTDVLLALHTDVFLRRRDALAWLRSQVSEDCPVAGWRMSPRSPGDGWKECVSHTFTAFWMPAMRRHGINWSFERWYEKHGRPEGMTIGWPDTESPLALALAEAGIEPRFLGEERNFEREDTEWYTHARSITGIRVTATEDAPLRRKIESYAAAALAEARERAERWRRESAAGSVADGLQAHLPLAPQVDAGGRNDSRRGGG